MKQQLLIGSKATTNNSFNLFRSDRLQVSFNQIPIRP